MEFQEDPMRTDVLNPMKLIAAILLCMALAACGSSNSGTDDGAGDVPLVDLLADTTVDAPQDVQADVAADVQIDNPTDTQTETAADVQSDNPTDAPDVLLPPAEPSCYQGLCAADPTHAPDPAAFGPFPVGVMRATFTDPNNKNADGSDRVLKTEIWYPAVEASRGQTGYAYDIKADGTDGLRQKYKDIDLGLFQTIATWEAPVRVGETKWPLVLFSHGAYGIRYQSVYFTVMLASHGYVVMSPDHQDNTLYEIMVEGYQMETLFQSAVRRPLDLLFLMDTMATKVADPADPFFDRVDTQNAASTGHSFGGLTSYAITSDPRIKAIVPMAPEASMVDLIAPEFGSALIGELSLPTLMMGGLLDRTLDYKTSQWDPWSQQPPPKWFLTLKRAGHYSFSDICRMNLAQVAPLWGDAEDAMDDGCNPVTNWDFNQAQKAINHYAIAFLNHFLRGSTQSADFLTSESGAEWADEIEFHAVPQ
jgi:predicted dienelactone hydrolase